MYVLIGFVVLILVVLARSVKVVPQKQVKIIERL
jgi:regulator of protease activity HflC (stomatin/prohibitin superfamily)